MPRKTLTLEEILKKAFLTEGDLERLGIRSRKTSQNLRSKGTDPLPYVKFGQTIRYLADAVRAYVEEHTISPERG